VKNDYGNKKEAGALNRLDEKLEKNGYRFKIQILSP
jgi:hypothetical protein